MTYRFGVFTFDDRTLTLLRSDRPVPIEPQPARALALLLERAGAIVTRDDLRAHLWDADTHVAFDRGLAYCIGELRAALGDSAENPRFVQTLPRRGFTFIAPVTRSDAPGANLSSERVSDARNASLSGERVNDSRSASLSGERVNDSRSASLSGERVNDSRSASLSGERPVQVTGWVAAAAIAAVALVVGAAGALMVARDRAPAAPRRPIVAVAVFENETGDPRHDRVIATLSDTVVERLTALGPLRVGVDGNAAILRRPRDARDWRAVAHDTHAAYLVSGQLQTRSDRLSLLMQLIRLDDGTHVWVHRINRPGDDRLTTIDADAAAQIESAVRATVLK
jgi:DNA-binding winged helix-turn-helix (wHTH) protein/TolB-like protein